MIILLANNTRSFQTAVSESLSPHDFLISFSEGIDNTLEDIQRYNAEIVLINWSKGDFDVADLCFKIRKMKHHKYIHVIIVAKRNMESEIPGLVEAGADDFILMPFGKNELFGRILQAQKSIKVQQNLSKSKKNILTLAKEDPLTSLLNRRALKDEALAEMCRASREKKFFSAILVTVANHQELMELYNNEIGDEILIEVSRRIKKSSRPYDKIGRFGISEFLIILPDAGDASSKKVADRIMNTLVSTSKPFSVKGKKVNLSISIGISEINPKDIVKNNNVDAFLVNDLILDSLIRRAELAMQRARADKKNTIKIYELE